MTAVPTFIWHGILKQKRKLNQQKWYHPVLLKLIQEHAEVPEGYNILYPFSKIVDKVKPLANLANVWGT